jgi:PLP dependent protein
MTLTEARAILNDRIAAVRTRIAAAAAKSGRAPEAVLLIAVTKTVGVDIAALLPSLGNPDLGENRPQELWRKAAAIPDARFHLIGHLQRNKLERTLPLVSLVHSVDSERLLRAIHEFGTARGTRVPVLLEVNCSRETNKGGFAIGDLPRVADSLQDYSAVEIRGLMTMAAYDAEPENCRGTFAELRTLRDQLQTRTGRSLPELSMGMSNDFTIAIEEGATLVRIGTTLMAGLWPADRVTTL